MTLRQEPGAQTAGFALRQAQGRERRRTAACVFSLTIASTRSYSITVSRLRRPFLSDRYFLITVRLLRRRIKIGDDDFALLARAFNRARALHTFFLTAWVFLPDHWHVVCEPVYPATISLAMKSVKQSSMSAINQPRGTEGQLW